MHRCVDDTDKMLLAGCENKLLVAPSRTGRIYVFAVEQDIVAVWRGPWETRNEGVVWIVDAGSELVDGGEVPIGHSKRPKIDIVICGCRAVDDDRAEYTVPVLARKMRVVPCIAVRSCGQSLKPAYVPPCLTYQAVPYWVAIKECVLLLPGAIGHSVMPPAPSIMLVLS